MTATDDHAERFTLLRPLLFTIAYEILGSATDADDVLQESYLRWAGVDLATVRDSKAYLAQLVTRQALNTVRGQVRRREDYVGPWLPEPLLVDDRDGAADVVLAESVSVAMLVVLETLSPDERAVFVLREVFGFSHDDIASAIGKSAVTVRQMAHRARAHVHARRRRYTPVDARESERITTEFLIAAVTGDLNELISMLAPDVVFTADSDGKASAARRPVRGAEKVARLLIGLMTRAGSEYRLELTTYNGAPAMIAYRHDQPDSVFTIEVSGGRISHFYVIRNPAKLTSVTVARRITR